MLNPRCSGRKGLRRTPCAPHPEALKGSHHHHARLLREAPHDGGLERSHQRPQPRRQLPHQQGTAPQRYVAMRIPHKHLSVKSVGWLFGRRQGAAAYTYNGTHSARTQRSRGLVKTA